MSEVPHVQDRPRAGTTLTPPLSRQELAHDLNADLSMKSEGLLGFVYSAFRLAVERRLRAL